MINLDLEKICIIKSFGKPPGIIDSILPGKGISGYGYAIPFDSAIQDAREQRINLDSYLTAQVAYYMSNFGNRKSPVLVWFANNSDLIFLFITSRHNISFMDIEHSFDSHTQDYVFQNAEPFMYYDEHGAIYRVYFRSTAVKNDDNLLFDMGNLFSPRLGNADEWIDLIMQAPLKGDYVVYSAVTPEKETIVKWKGKKIVVECALCSLSYNGIISSSVGFDDGF